MPTVKVTSRVEHDGKVYEAGDSVEVTVEQKQALVEAGVVEAGNSRADSAQEGEVVEAQKGKK